MKFQVQWHSASYFGMRIILVVRARFPLESFSDLFISPSVLTEKGYSSLFLLYLDIHVLLAISSFSWHVNSWEADAVLSLSIWPAFISWDCLNDT